jgi:hypothetical protein
LKYPGLHFLKLLLVAGLHLKYIRLQGFSIVFRQQAWIEISRVALFETSACGRAVLTIYQAVRFRYCFQSNPVKNE